MRHSHLDAPHFTLVATDDIVARGGLPIERDGAVRAEPSRIVAASDR